MHGIAPTLPLFIADVRASVDESGGALLGLASTMPLPITDERAGMMDLALRDTLNGAVRAFEVAPAPAELVASVGARMRSVEGGRGLARLGAVLEQATEDGVALGCVCEIEGGPFARVDGALATRERVFFADAEIVGCADLPADAEVFGAGVTVVFLAF